MTEADRSFVIRVIVLTLSAMVVTMLAVLLTGLFDPVVDNDKIFAILGPMSQQSLGALVAIVSGLIGYKIGKASDKAET